ncbi:hypothetical protein MCOR25_002426 [Pyricularia grisea]|uniref:Mitochondrial inner membrane protein 1 protein n=1 Tax=Pyricularia grisea TaxID=148305 RepID=A0A6P8BHC7_PYRGI|nr:uncharacterized protein PgNI_00970 [Pyricularia grisea]KAI6377702.1 hypothetical protein MCOR25_002426 [Pyricularia grisea]TLD16281.1 hypothetical protein PgNI_00970 [Pyricularia grisea]
MLRGARPLLSFSTRAIESAKVSKVPIGRKLALEVRPRIPSPSAGRPVVFRAARLQYSTKKSTDPEEEYARKVVGVDPEHDRKVAQEKLQPNPDGVSSESSVRHVLEPRRRQIGKGAEEGQDALKKGLGADIETVKDTFNLSGVPPLSYKLGLAGTLPYLGTSLSTVFLSWNLSTQWPTSSNLLNSIMFSHENAAYYFQLLEHIQLGYGAVIISFLGAIHWGLEYAEKAPHPQRTKFRYGMGVVAPMLAWPTLLLPVEYALIGQFAAFSALYFADAKAATRGWAPPWYGTYRFVLTFVVGSAIFVSLLWRARLLDHGGNEGAAQNISGIKEGDLTREMPEAEWRRLEAEEKERLKKEKEEAERKKKEEEKKKSQEKKGKDGEKSGSKDKKEEGKKDEGKKDDSEGKSKE